MKTIYFAHSKEDYDTTRKARAMNALYAKFPEHEVVNPREIPSRDSGRWRCNDPMCFWRTRARECDALAFLVCHDKTIAPGVMAEALEAHIHGKPVYEIHFTRYDEIVIQLCEIDSAIQTIEQARERATRK